MRIVTIPLFALCAVLIAGCSNSDVRSAAKGAAIGGAVSAIYGGGAQSIVRGALAGGVVGGISNL